MRVNKQVHGEVRKYFYERVTLSIRVTFDSEMLTLFTCSNTMALVYHELTNIDPGTLAFIKQLSIQIRDWQRPPRLRKCFPMALPSMEHLFRRLAGLEKLVMTFDIPNRSPISVYQEQTHTEMEDRRVEDVKRWLIDHIPASVNVSWPHADAARFYRSTALEQRLWQAIQDRTVT